MHGEERWVVGSDVAMPIDDRLDDQIEGNVWLSSPTRDRENPSLLNKHQVSLAGLVSRTHI